jgi:predicted amidohydrolase
MKGLRVAAAQYPIEFVGSWEGWRLKLESWVSLAARSGAELLVFPEYGGMELASLFPSDVHGDLQRQLPVLARLAADVLAVHAELASRHDVHILAASLPVEAEGAFRNRAWLVGPGGPIGFQEKLVMTRFERERWGISPGAGVKVFDTPLGRLGVSICYDAEFPLIARRQAEAGADVILVPSCTDGLPGYHRVRIGARARALENQCYAVTSHTVGMATWSPAVDENVGAAAAFAPPDLGFPADGVLAEGPLSEPRWVFAELDLAALRMVRAEGQVTNARDWPLHAERGALPADLVAPALAQR